MQSVESLRLGVKNCEFNLSMNYLFPLFLSNIPLLSPPTSLSFSGVAFFPGHLTHTNEVLVNIGEDYFAKRTSAQSLEILSRRSSLLQSRLSQLEDEIDRIASQMRFGYAVFDRGDGTVEINEKFVEEEEEEEGGEERERERERERRERERELRSRMAEMSEMSSEELLSGMEDAELRERLSSLLALVCSLPPHQNSFSNYRD